MVKALGREACKPESPEPSRANPHSSLNPILPGKGLAQESTQADPPPPKASLATVIGSGIELYDR